LWRVAVIVVVVVAVGLLLMLKKRGGESPVVSDELAERSNLPVMIELGSHGCKACEAMKPVIAELENDFSDKLEIKFFDVKSNPEIARQYKIRVIPTQIFEDSDGVEVFRHEGYFSKEEILTVFRDRKLIQ